VRCTSATIGSCLESDMDQLDQKTVENACDIV
jgi:hypothetical protein